MASLIGKEIGKYRITERLGQGGMAEVYAGVHTHLDRKVAVKVLHSYLLEGGDFVARFKREAKAVANLRHPNIVQVYDFDIQDQLIFMVMEYIDGVNLHAKLVEVGNKGERMPIKLIGSIINDIASALDYAHSKDMLHRDIKPSNIMIDKDDKAYLTDFGIAKLLTDQKFTATGTLVGTPAYMSPEQGLGDEVGKESDIYSLGVVAFEMLTGQVPYDAKTPIGIVHKQINDPVPDMSALVDGVPDSAQDVINRALAKSPESRFSSAEDLVGALRTALSALEATDRIAVPVEEPPTVVDDGLEAPTVTMDADELEQPTVVMEEKKPAAEKKPEKEAKPAKEPVKKSKIPVWAYAVGGVALLAVIGVVLTQVLNLGGTGSTTDPGVVELFVNPDTQDQGIRIMDEVPDGNFEIIEAGSGLAFASGNHRTLEAPDGNTEWDGYLYFDIDDGILFGLPEDSEVTVYIEYLDQGTDSFDLQYDAHFGGDLGDGRFRDAGVLTKTATDQFKTAQFNLAAAYLGNRNNGADLRISDIGDGAEIIRELRLVWTPTEDQQFQSDAATGDESEGGQLFAEAVAQCEAGNFAECIDLCYQAIAAGYETSDVYNQIGRSYRYLGEYEQALEPLDIAIELDPENYWAYYNRGAVRYEVGGFGGAIEDLNRATEIDPGTHAAWYALGWMHYQQNAERYKNESLEALSRAIEIRPDYYPSHQMRGELLWQQFGDLDAALEDLNLAVEYCNTDDPGPFNARGLYYKETGQFELCIPDYDQFVIRDPENPWAFIERGECFFGLKEYDAARSDFDHFMVITDGDPGAWSAERDRVQAYLAEMP